MPGLSPLLIIPRRFVITNRQMRNKEYRSGRQLSDIDVIHDEFDAKQKLQTANNYFAVQQFLSWFLIWRTLPIGWPSFISPIRLFQKLRRYFTKSAVNDAALIFLAASMKISLIRLLHSNDFSCSETGQTGNTGSSARRQTTW